MSSCRLGPNRAPLWPRGIVGSISHCEGYCAVVAARQDRFAGLGLDVERGEPLGRNLVKRVCRPTEIARLDSDDARPENGTMRLDLENR